ncbi:hypothetical protein ANOM_010728 [Aspergillus nomiae NRRL 13137]|uniref:Uncharacterized protein n=1 Tax=Aspergillus nomiae NRRL (strain ATCC 15546 / NRRL 13137 / CBS 260.88 / M93) TaxID=1509407 RepID=A0A0L1IME3_ASPN3|nr:uncharacterized protein ANOM_010728 [Aspergillus nomiae NRRL 13137]KNG80348.1 hypothetical protein ANOM_010728 [Aspergillus nomiae NRRL 13137]
MTSSKPLPLLNLTGNWVMEKHLSTNVEPMMKMQGLNWIIRRAFQYVSILFTITEYASIGADSSPLALHIDVEHTVTGGFNGTTEKRTLDWNPHVQKDYVFGCLSVRSRLIRGVEDADGHVRPALQLHMPNLDESVYKFMRGAVSFEGEPEEGFLLDESPQQYVGTSRGSWLHTVSCNDELGWTMEQVWGFEMICGERYHTRRIVVINKSGDCTMGRTVYKWHSGIRE